MGILKDILPLLYNKNYSEPILTLGRQKVEGSDKFLDEIGIPAFSVDISRHETPDYVADLVDTRSFIEAVQRTYSLIYDGGTIEHTASPIKALESITSVLRPNGTFISHQILNISGHGFWCLSPEWLVKWLGSNGFGNIKVYVKSALPLGKFLNPWRRISTDKILVERQEILGFFPVYVVLIATKIAEEKIFESNNLQQNSELKPKNKFYHWFWRTRIWRFPRVKKLGD